jgi:hypothetical protein
VNISSVDHGVARRLGALEELFWLYDQASPMHFAMVAEVEGNTEQSDWRRALHDLQRRHPLMTVKIDPATRSFKPAPDTQIPLRIALEGASWIEELRRELATPFVATGGPLIRAALLPRSNGATLILVAHHSISDGLSLTMALRDLFHLLEGNSLPVLSPVDAQESAFGCPTLETLSAVVCDSERSAVAPAPAVETLRLTAAETTKLVGACREHGATVQAALCTAVASAGRALTDSWNGVVTFNSPVSTRNWTGAADQCALSVAASLLSFPPRNGDDFWGQVCYSACKIDPLSRGIGVQN